MQKSEFKMQNANFKLKEPAATSPLRGEGRVRVSLDRAWRFAWRDFPAFRSPEWAIGRSFASAQDEKCLMPSGDGMALFRFPFSGFQEEE
jgi:hypothetical protein